MLFLDNIEVLALHVNLWMKEWRLFFRYFSN
jgi:hypothetical protein